MKHNINNELLEWVKFIKNNNIKWDCSPEMEKAIEQLDTPDGRKRIDARVSKLMEYSAKRSRQ
jgi:hypothetical protein